MTIEIDVCIKLSKSVIDLVCLNKSNLIQNGPEAKRSTLYLNIFHSIGIEYQHLKLKAGLSSKNLQSEKLV